VAQALGLDGGGDPDRAPVPYEPGRGQVDPFFAHGGYAGGPFSERELLELSCSHSPTEDCPPSATVVVGCVPIPPSVVAPFARAVLVSVVLNGPVPDPGHLADPASAERPEW